MKERLREVLPRDGFQDVPRFIPTNVKTAIVESLHQAGCRWIEVTSFVHPAQVPQFTDADTVVAAARSLPGLYLSAFVPNRRGLERALAASVDEVSLAIASTDDLSLANFHRDRVTMTKEVAEVATAAVNAGLDVSLTVGGAFGCPFEGGVPAEVVLDLVKWALDLGVPAILLADTIGAGMPEEVTGLVEAAVELAGLVPVGIHIHGIHGMASVEAALDAGAGFVDASLGGIGGCPFVPNAPGNVDTREVVGALRDRGVNDLPDVEALDTLTKELNSLSAG